MVNGFEAEDLVRQAIKRHGDHIAVACSFGKDSMAVLHMALKYNPNIKVIFENTGVEFPETIRYKEMMKKEWNLNLYETKPLKSFWECVKEYGLPTIRKGGGKGSNAPKCCQYLKEKPALILQRELGVNAVITGLQACESRARSLIAKRYDNKKVPYMSKEIHGEIVEFCSQRWFTRVTNMWNYHPIMLWSVEEVWEYTHKHKIPINEVYTKWGGIYPRCGCLPCTAYISWEDRLSKSHPKLFRTLKKIQCPEQTVLVHKPKVNKSKEVKVAIPHTTKVVGILATFL